MSNKSRVPHIYVILFGLVVLAIIATWIIPSGEFVREPDEAGRMVVVPGSFHLVEPNRVGFFKGMMDLYEGMLDASPVVFFVFISFAALGLIIESGAFERLVERLLKTFATSSSRLLIIPIFISLLGGLSSTVGIFEEAFPFVPVFVGIAISMGFDAVVGMAIVALGVGLGYSGAAMNPFTVGVAQGIAGLQPMSGAGFRVLCHIISIIVASTYTIRYANDILKNPEKSLVFGIDTTDRVVKISVQGKQSFGIREKSILVVLAVGVVIAVLGSKFLQWYFAELCAVFVIMGLVTGVIMGWSPNEIANRVAGKFTEAAVICLVIGLARGILIVLRDGNIVDTIVYGLSLPLGAVPRWMAAELMLVIQTLLNLIIPSGSGQAATVMPIMTPLADILGIPRQVAVLAFQFGDGLSNILWPTAFMPVICGLARVPVDKWLRWFVPLFGLLLVTQMGCIMLAIAINYH